MRFSLAGKVGNKFAENGRNVAPIAGRRRWLNALAVFAKVVEAGSFSEAARRLKIPISTVSRAVSELEDQLGARLIERSTRTCRSPNWVLRRSSTPSVAPS